AAAITLAAALLSFGAITFTGAPAAAAALAAGARLGVLPLDALHLAIAVAAALLVSAVGWRGDRGPATLAAVSPLVLVFLPWLPFAVPQAFLIWTGGVLSLVWLVVA